MSQGTAHSLCVGGGGAVTLSSLSLLLLVSPAGRVMSSVASSSV